MYVHISMYFFVYFEFSKCSTVRMHYFHSYGNLHSKWFTHEYKKNQQCFQKFLPHLATLIKLPVCLIPKTFWTWLLKATANSLLLLKLRGFMLSSLSMHYPPHSLSLISGFFRAEYWYLAKGSLMPSEAHGHSCIPQAQGKNKGSVSSLFSLITFIFLLPPPQATSALGLFFS